MTPDIPPIPTEVIRPAGTPPPIPAIPCGAARRPKTSMDDAQMPRTYMVWCLLACLGCFITGIIGLVFASQVNQKWRMGDVEGARRASANVRLMLLASCVLALINIPYLLLYWAL